MLPLFGKLGKQVMMMFGFLGQGFISAQNLKVLIIWHSCNSPTVDEVRRGQNAADATLIISYIR